MGFLEKWKRKPEPREVSPTESTDWEDFDALWQEAQPKETGPAGDATVEQETDIMQIVAGLGNPGSKYENTRHNAGWQAIDYLADKYGVTVDRLNFSAMTNTVMIGGEKCLLMKPTTFMNNSGEAVGAAARFFKVPPEKVIILSDDINLEPGKLRIRRKGSAGGHNGLKSIIAHLGSDQFPRIRIGVGERANENMDLADFVLATFSKEDQKKMKEAYEQAADAVELIIKDNIQEAMNRYN